MRYLALMVLVLGGGSPAARDDLADLRVTPESDVLWREMGRLMQHQHRLLWELYELQDAPKTDQAALTAKLGEIKQVEDALRDVDKKLAKYRVKPAKRAATKPQKGPRDGIGRCPLEEQHHAAAAAGS